MVGKVADGLDDLVLRLRGRNDFQQVEIAWRVEEMSAEPVLSEVVTSPLGERGDRNSGSVGTDDRARAPRRVDLLQQTALDVQPLNDRLDNPVALLDAGQVGVEAAGRDELPGVRREERIRLQSLCTFQSLLRGVRRDVKQQGRHACVGKMRGNLRAHGPRAEYGHRSKQHLFRVWWLEASMRKCPLRGLQESCANYGDRRLDSRSSRMTRTPVAILSSRPFFPYATLARVGSPDTPLPSFARPGASLLRRTPSG